MTILKDFNDMKANMQTKKTELEAANRTDEIKLEALQAEYEQHILHSDFDMAEKTKQSIKSIEASMETRQDILDVIADNRGAAMQTEAKKVVQKFKAEKQRLEKQLQKQLDAAESKRQAYFAELEKIAGLNQDYASLVRELTALRPLGEWEKQETKQAYGIDLNNVASPHNIKLYSFPKLAMEVKKAIEEVR